MERRINVKDRKRRVGFNMIRLLICWEIFGFCKFLIWRIECSFSVFVGGFDGIL